MVAKSWSNPDDSLLFFLIWHGYAWEFCFRILLQTTWKKEALELITKVVFQKIAYSISHITDVFLKSQDLILVGIHHGEISTCWTIRPIATANILNHRRKMLKIELCWFMILINYAAGLNFRPRKCLVTWSVTRFESSCKHAKSVKSKTVWKHQSNQKSQKNNFVHFEWSFVSTLIIEIYSPVVQSITDDSNLNP